MFVKKTLKFGLLCLASVTVSIVYAAPCEEYWLTKQHQCQVDYIRELSAAKGMEELWNECQLEFQRIIDAWKACVETNIMSRFNCNLDKASQIATGYVLFFVKADNKNPELGDEYFRNVEKKCPKATV